MSEPIFNDMAEDIYANLPEHFRRMDPGQDYHFKKLIAAFTPVVDQIEKMAESFDYTPPQDGGDPNDPNNTSALVDPSKADPRYFPWLAQIYGVRLNSELGYEEQRQQLVNAAIGYRAGTPEAIEAAAKTFLLGDKYARVYGHSTAEGVGEGGPWDLLLVTKSSETLKNLFPESLNIAANIGAVTSQDMTFYRRNEVFNPSFETNDANWTVLGSATKTRQPVSDFSENRQNPVPNSNYYLNVVAPGGVANSGIRGSFTCAATPTLVARRTNLYTDPSFSTLTGKTVGPGVAWSLATSWADSGTTSIRLTPSIIGGTNPNTYINIFANENTLNGLVPGKTYTISATINLSQVQGGTLSDNARRIAVHSGTGSPAPLIATSEQAPNALGPNRVSCTFTVPVGATRAYIYLYNGSYRTSDVAYWDSVLIEETSEVRPYFDGNTEYNELTESNYTWTGTVNNSTSVEVLGNVMTYSAWVYMHSTESLMRQVCLRVTDHEGTVYLSSPANKVGWQRLSLKCPLPITSGTIQHDIICTVNGAAPANTIFFGVDGVMVEQYTRYLYSYFDSRTDPVSAPYKTSYLGGDNTTSWQAIQLSARLITDPDVYAGRAYKIGTDYPLEIDLDLIKARAASAPGGVNVTMPWIIGNPGFLSFAAKMPRVTNIDETSHQIMFKARTTGAAIPLKIGVKWYTNTGIPINDTTPEIINAGTLNGEWQQFNIWTASPPAGADQVGIWLYYDLLNMPPTLDYTQWQMIFAETGLRTDPETEWTPVNADPGQIVARLGAKPAGYKLHYAQLVATWDTVESVFPTWSLLDGNTWRDIDESGVQPPP